MLGVYLAKQLNRIEENEYSDIVRELQKLPEKIEAVLDNLNLYQKAASRYFNHNSVFYIGRNVDYALGLEDLSETERNFLYPFGILRSRRTEAWNHFFDRTGNIGGGSGCI